MYYYYMTQRPAMPGAMPRKGLQEIEDLDPSATVEEIGRGAYAKIGYDRALTEQEISDYELTAPREKIHYKGFLITQDTRGKTFEVAAEKDPDTIIAFYDTRDLARMLEDLDGQEE